MTRATLIRRGVVVAGCVAVLVAVPLLARPDAQVRTVDPYRCTRALDSARSVISIASGALDIARRTVGSVPTGQDVAELTDAVRRMNVAAPRWQRDAKACRAGAR